jgi:pimeloyl-ACP methyl ester carboxylesterase
VHQTEVTLHGHRVACRIAGDPALPVLLLIHGITSSSATWDAVIPGLAEYAHVIAPDLLGHGDSDKPRADYSLGGFASGLRDLLEHLGHERVTVVGHSLGGGVAMQFAYQYYEHCDRLVLVSSGGLGREVSLALRAATLPGAELVLPVIANTHVRDAGAAIGRLLGRLPMRPRPSVAEVARGYATLAESTARTAFVHTLRSVVEPGGQRVHAGDLLYLAEGRPTLIVWGALDTVIPVSHAFEAHAMIPGSTLEVFEQSRHFPHMDEPARFVKVVSHFLGSTTPAPFDRVVLRDRIAARSRAVVEQRERDAEQARLALMAAAMPDVPTSEGPVPSEAPEASAAQSEEPEQGDAEGVRRHVHDDRWEQAAAAVPQPAQTDPGRGGEDHRADHHEPDGQTGVRVVEGYGQARGDVPQPEEPG